MCVPSAWPVTDIGGLLERVLSLCLGPGPGTHHTQETGPGPELHIKHTGNTHRKPCLNLLVQGLRSLAHSSILPSSPPDPRGGPAAKALLHTQLTTCLIFSAVYSLLSNPPNPTPSTPPTLDSDSYFETGFMGAFSYKFSLFLIKNVSYTKIFSLDRDLQLTRQQIKCRRSFMYST